MPRRKKMKPANKEKHVHTQMRRTQQNHLYRLWVRILLKLPESPLLCMGMNGSPERSGGK